MHIRIQCIEYREFGGDIERNFTKNATFQWCDGNDVRVVGESYLFNTLYTYVYICGMFYGYVLSTSC